MSNMQEYVCGFLFFDYVQGGNPLDNKTKVLLIGKTKPEWQAGLYNGIGGKVEPNEKPFDAMVREFWEEADLLIRDWNHFCVIESNDYKVHFYKASVQNIKKWNSKTSEKVEAFELEKLPPNLVRSLNILIPLARQKEFVSTVIKESL